MAATESLFRASVGFSLDDNVEMRYGVAAPTASSGVVAPVGSVYMQNASGTDGGAFWVKYGEADTAWRNVSNPVGIKWVNSVKATTVDDISAFSGAAETFSDDEIGITLTVGDRIASKFDDKIYVVNAGTWTVATDGVLVAQDAFFSEYTFIFTADPALQGPAAVLYDGSDLIKLASFDFEYATSIKLSAGYTPSNGNPAAGDSVEKAIGNLDANAADMQTALGISQGAVNLGTWATAAYLTNNTETVKTALDKLNTGLAAARNAVGPIGPVTGTPVVIDSMKVDDFHAAHWLVVCYETAALGNKIAEEVFALHDGTTGADATDVDYTKYAKVKTTPVITGLSVTVALAGVGAAQTMDLMVSSTTSVTVKAVRMSV